MKNHKLNNLRELSTEEQLHLTGGLNSTGCSCKCTCNCEGDTPKATQKSATNDVADGVKKKIENGLL